MQSVNAFIRTQGITCAVINVVLNPVVVWLGNRQMNFTPLWGGNSIVVDTAVTSVVLSLLVALFTASRVRQALDTGGIEVSAGSPRAGRLLSYLPREAWALGLLLGLGIACILTPLTFGLWQPLVFPDFPLRGSHCSRPCTRVRWGLS